MRVTFQSQTRNYLSRMNNNLSSLTSSNEKLASGRRYSRSSDSIMDAGKALKVRKYLSDNERYLTNIRDTEGRTETAESSVRQINELLTTTKEKIIYGMNASLAEEDMQILAKEVKNAQDELLQIMNKDYAGKHLFAAAGNKDGEPPFIVDTNGKLLYNGTPVDEMQQGANGIEYNGSPIPYNNKNYVDIGYGYNIVNGKVDPNTAFDESFSGAEIFGYGVDDETGLPKNAFSLLGVISGALADEDEELLSKSLATISKTADYLLKSITDIGTRMSRLENAGTQIDKENENFLDWQNKLEYVDYGEEIMYNKGHEMSWMVTLQLGSKILPTSLFDFLR